MNKYAMRHGARQAGGTILGLIIGLIIGLAIAVGVAITIKNTPLPFSNKLGKQNRQQEPTAGQVSDPNKAMYGNRDAVKQAARDVPRQSEEAKAAEAQAQAQASPPPTGPTEQDQLDAKLAELKEKLAKLDAKPAAVRAETAAAKAADAVAADPSEKFTYFLQAGAFLEQGDAENARAKLALIGVSANIAERKSDNGTLYRVRVGPFGQLEAMNRVRGRLTDNGVDVAVIRVPK
jgi:cell division protein FtsN